MPPGFPFDFGKAWFKSVEFGSEDEKRTEEAKKRKAVAAMLDFQDDQINRSQDIFVISKLLGWLSTKRPLNSPVIPWAPEVSIATCLKEISMVVVRWAIAACAIVLPQSGFGQVSNSRMVAGWYVAEVNSTYGPSCVTSKKMPGGTELNIKLFPDVQRLTLEFANSDWQSLTSGGEIAVVLALNNSGGEWTRQFTTTNLPQYGLEPSIYRKMESAEWVPLISAISQGESLSVSTGGNSIGTYSLAGSKVALKALLECGDAYTTKQRQQQSNDPFNGKP